MSKSFLSRAARDVAAAPETRALVERVVRSGAPESSPAEASTGIDCRDLLKRYMRVVLANESVSFMDSYHDGSAAHTPVGEITHEEIAELRRIENEAWADTQAAGG